MGAESLVGAAIPTDDGLDKSLGHSGCSDVAKRESFNSLGEVLIEDNQVLVACWIGGQ